jgi:lipopolysaccharide export system permease protein
MGKMSSQNEILAMKSAGIGLGTIVAPMFFLSFALTLFAAYVNLCHAPNSVGAYRKFFRDIVREKPMRFIAPGMFNDYFPGFVIYVKNLSNGIFDDLKIWQFNEKDSLLTYTAAKRGKMIFDKAADSLLLELYDGNAEKFNTDGSTAKKTKTLGKPNIPQVVFFRNVTVNLPMKDFFSQEESSQKRLRNMNLSELLEMKKNLKTRKGMIPSSQMRQQNTLINVRIGNNLANAVGILTMTLLAIPLGIRAKRTDAASNVGIALGLCFSYYFVTVILSWVEDRPDCHPDILIWIPNIVLAALGFLLFGRMSRH